MKSVLRHVVSIDHRDEAVFPSRGSWLQFTSALAGLGGGVAHVRTELQAEANGTLPYADNVVSTYHRDEALIASVYVTGVARHVPGVSAVAYVKML